MDGLSALGRSGPHARLALLLAAAVAGFAAEGAALLALLSGAVLLLSVAAPRRLLLLAGWMVATALAYAAIVLLAGDPPAVAAWGAARFALPLSAGLAVAASTPPSAWLLLAPRARGLAAVAAVLAVLPALARDAQAVMDAGRLRGYGPVAAGLRGLPAAFVRAVRRGRLTDEALAQAGDPALRRVPAYRHRLHWHDAAVLAAAVAALGVALA